ncbi:TetR/AcrR family transcriptional regulator [Streptomyces sp. YIM S03343]
MLLNDPGDTELADMRRAALEDFVRLILAAASASASASSAPPKTDATKQQLRAQMVVALGVGMAVLRSAVAVQPLGDAGPEDLAPLLRLVLTALLEEPRDGSG